jgi:hypothetical protein
MSSDQIPAGECAIFSVDNMAELRMLLPEHVNGGDGEMPGVVAFLLACFMRSRDPEFVVQQLAWLDRLEAEIENELFGAQ